MSKSTYLVPSNRGSSFAWAMFVAVVLGAVVLCVFDRAEEGWIKEKRIDHPTVFPYLAAVVLFYSSLVWVILEARGTLRATVRNPSPKSVRWSVGVFVVLTGVLTAAGMAGPEAREAVRVLNCYLFVGESDACAFIEKYCQGFNYVAAASNASAIAAVTYLGFIAFELIRDIDVGGGADGSDGADKRFFILRICTRSLSEFAMLASTVFVTSTLALYLLFIAAAEVKPGVPPKQGEKPRVEVSSVRKAELDCTGQAGVDSFKCTAMMPPEAKRSRAVAPVMAFVAGLSFTGVLFFLFVSAGSSLDEKIQRMMEAARKNHTGTTAFSAKTWLEEEGLTEGPKDFVFRGLALLAPAATGALTFLTGA